MDMLKRFLWKNLGITLARKFFITTGIFVASCIATILFIVLFSIFHFSFFNVLALLSGIPAGLLIINGLYTTFRWDFATKEEKQEIEQEIAFKQLKRRVNDKDFQR
jgi:hypothetical protein